MVWKLKADTYISNSMEFICALPFFSHKFLAGKDERTFGKELLR